MKYIVGLLALVVVGVVIYPLFAHARVGNHKRPCVGHIKQLAVASLMYQSDNNERFPHRDVWMDVLDPYTKNSFLFHCPLLQTPKFNLALYGFSFNATLSASTTPQAPKTVELLFDSINLARNASGSLDSLPKPGRHEGKNNIAFADGHAKPVQSP